MKEEMKAAKRFFGNKRYVFRKELHMLSLGENLHYNWVNEADGKEIKVLSSGEGAYDVFVILPQWCEEIYEQEAIMQTIYRIPEEERRKNIKQGIKKGYNMNTQYYKGIPLRLIYRVS